MRIAIVGGTGKMGQWFAGFLKKDGHQVIITGRDGTRLRGVAGELGVGAAPLAEAVGQAEAVLVSVPIDSFEGVVKALGAHTRPGQVIVDVTSVKAAPVESMHRHIKGGRVLGTHPLFGPGAAGLAGKTVVLTPTDPAESDLAAKVARYLEERGARAVTMTPAEHDRAMAVVLGLSHFIGIVSAETLAGFGDLKQLEEVGGTTYKLLATLAGSVLSEDADFYASLQVGLPGVAEVEGRFLENARRWAGLVKERDSAAFSARMKDLRERAQAAGLDPGRAYRDMYRLLETGEKAAE